MTEQVDPDAFVRWTYARALAHRQPRYRAIADHERHLAENGTVILKFWLNVSADEQKRRFLSRLNEPEKHWKFSSGDLEERKLWDAYMDAYQQALAPTSKPWAPWYAIPADSKPYMQARVAEIIINALESIGLHYPEPSEEDRVVVSMIVRPEKRQVVLDALQSAIGSTEGARINVLPLEVTLPRPAEKEDGDEGRSVTGTREELYNEIEKGAKLDGNYLLLVFLSTIVATIGLVENNVAVIIGAMVIAPLLGPNIALAFSTSLGDTRLMWSALKTSFAGLGFALVLLYVAGMLLQIEPLGSEILARTDVGISGVLLALASGAAAVLSLATGISSALVGVMVAVALLPPTATFGMMLGIGQYDYALGAALLLAVNVVCVNLSAKLVFLYRGVKPRTWLEKQKARQSTPVYIFVWGLLLVILLGAMYVRHTQL